MKMSDIELLERKFILDSRKSFYAYRCYIHHKDKVGWFQYDVCQHLQQWYIDFKAGLRPILILNTPPQHGKSTLIVDFVSWLIGKEPSLKTIYASFSDTLSTRANRNLKRIMLSSKYKKIFDVRLPEVGAKNKDGSINTQNLIEFLDVQGSFRNTTIGGSVTGESLDVGIIDDPIKGREQANSQLIRDKCWDWFTDDFYSRFSENAGLISIATRWHIDDPIGRLIDKYPTAKVLKYQAIATHDEKYRKQGEALFPEHKSLDFLLARKAMLSEESWESLYQQEPILQGGNLIKTDNFIRYDTLPLINYSIITVDTASKTGTRNDYSVFMLAGTDAKGHVYIIDVLRGKYEFNELKIKAIDFFTKYKDYRVLSNSIHLSMMVVEDKSAGIQLIQELKRTAILPVQDIQRSTDKYTRLQEVIGYINCGYVHIPQQGAWVHDFVEECKQFNANDGDHDDQVDTLIDAIKLLIVDKNPISIWERL